MANNFYNGNQLIKSSGVVVNYTQQQLEEYIKCASDPIYFISNYCKVISLDRGIVNFELYDYQKKLIRAYNDNRFVISMMGRQNGKCCIKTTLLKVRNKHTGEIKEMTAEEFHQLTMENNNES